MTRAAAAAMLLLPMLSRADPDPAAERQALGWTGREAPVRRLLLVGFDTYAQAASRPEPATRALVLPWDGRRVGGMTVRAISVPTAYDACMAPVRDAVASFRPDAILAVGYHASGPACRVELAAANRDDAALADEAGTVRRGDPIEPDGPARRWTTLRAGRVARALHDAGLPVDLSDDAGGFVCNHLFYRLLRGDGAGAAPRAGFLHVPLPGGEVPPGRASLAVEEALRALAGDDLVAACVQMEIAPGNPAANLSRIEAYAREAAAAGAQIVVFPEMATTGLAPGPAGLPAHCEPIPGPATDRLAAVARDLGVHLVCGVAERDGERCYNAAVLVGPDGTLLARYRKIHRYGTDADWAAAGTEPAVFADTPLGRIGILICHDIVYPDAFEPLAAAGCDLVAFPTNWIGGTDPIRYAGPLAARHGIPILVANRHGSEGDVSFSGRSGVAIPAGIYAPARTVSGDPHIVLTWLPGPLARRRAAAPPREAPPSWNEFARARVARLGGADWAAREEATAALRAAGEAVTPILASLERPDDPEVDARIGGLLAVADAARWLGQYEYPNGETVPFLLRLSPLRGPGADPIAFTGICTEIQTNFGEPSAADAALHATLEGTWDGRTMRFRKTYAWSGGHPVWYEGILDPTGAIRGGYRLAEASPSPDGTFTLLRAD